MNEKQYYYGGSYVSIVGGVEGKPELVVVDANNDYGDLMVVKRSELIPKEESYMYKEALKREAELKAIVADAQNRVDEIADKVVDSALIALSSRMKFNAFFSKDVGSGSAGWAMLVIKELEELVKDKSKEALNTKKWPF